MSNEAHVLVQDVDVTYNTSAGPRPALRQVSLCVQRGEFVSVIGPSGCGKSTLLRLIAGLQAPTRGEVRIDGRPPREAQQAKQIGVVFQDPSLLPWCTVRQNVRLPLRVNRGAGGRDADELVRLVGLQDFAAYYPHQLSGGMQQRVALARSFVTSPSLLLMDEPLGALDEMTRSAMRFELLRIWRSEVARRDCTIVFVTHSIGEAVLLSDRVIVISGQPGRIAGTLRVDLPRPRPEEIETDIRFLEHVRELRALLRDPALL